MLFNAVLFDGDIWPVVVCRGLLSKDSYRLMMVEATFRITELALR